MISTWETESEYQIKKIKDLRNDIEKFESEYLPTLSVDKENLWDHLYTWIEKHLSFEGIEFIISLMMEPYDSIINPLISNMSSNEDLYFNIPTYKKLSELKNIISRGYKDIIEIDFSKNEPNEKFWFISKNKEEPRLANRFDDEGSELEQPLAIARDINDLYYRILDVPEDQILSEFLRKNSDLRHVVRRCFIAEKLPYSEIQDNSIGSNLMPIDMLRLKLSFFGAQKFDPRSDKWLRICMYQGAPLMNEISQTNDRWIYS